MTPAFLVTNVFPVFRLIMMSTNYRTLIGDVICIADGLSFVLGTMVSKHFHYISVNEFLFVRCLLMMAVAIQSKFLSRNFTLYRNNTKSLVAIILTAVLGSVAILNPAMIRLFWKCLNAVGPIVRGEHWRNSRDYSVGFWPKWAREY